MLVQHIPNMFTYREQRGGRDVCVCVWENDIIPLAFCLCCMCVCVTGSTEPTRKWLLPICQVIGWEAVKRAFRDSQKCKQGKSEREGLTQERGGLIERREVTFSITTKLKTKHGKWGNGGSRAATNALIQPHNGQWKLLSLSFWMCSMSKNFTSSCCNPVKAQSNTT